MKEQCLAFLEALRWPYSIRCIECGGGRIFQYVTAEGTSKRINAQTGVEEINPVPA